MIDSMELPDLKLLPDILRMYNLRKLYEYLLYFAKN